MKKAVIALLSAVFSMMILGFVMMWSIGGNPRLAHSELPEIPFGLLQNQLLWTGIGLTLMWAVSRVDLRRWRIFERPTIVILVFLLVTVCIPGIVHEIWGAETLTALSLRVLFQPSFALAGLTIVLFMAGWYQYGNLRPAYLFWLPVTMLYSLVGIITFVEQDFITALLVMMTGSAMMIFGGVKIMRAVVVMYSLLPLYGLIMVTIQGRIFIERLAVFYAPRDYSHLGYCIPGSVLAFRAGGWFGAGLGQIDNMLFDPYGGYITAAIAQELGLAGVLVMIAWYIVIAVSGVYIGIKAKDRLGRLMAFGIVSLMAIQVFLNLEAVTNRHPIRALDLPFVSYGCLNLCVSLIWVGILLNVAKIKGSVKNQPGWLCD